ncbi:MAG: chorismate--pyruvate lyase family protein [Acidimicrobiales bacterium]
MALKLRLELALRHSDTSVTEFLEQLVGEPLDAHERRHKMIRASTPNLLGVEDGHRLLQRSAVLRGAESGRPYMYAESLLVPSRLPVAVCRQLENSSHPIGRILAEEGIGFSRFPLPCVDRPGEGAFPVPDDYSPVPDDYLLARTYRIDIEGVPTMLISEWFLPALDSFLGPS